MIAISVWFLYAVNPFLMYRLDDAKSDRAQMDVIALHHAIQQARRANAEKGKEPPTSLNEALPFLSDAGRSTLIDPWGKPYQFRWDKENGEPWAIIWTVGPDGQEISTLRLK